MSLNCAWCKELIEDEPVRKGRLYFCSYECLEDYESKEEDHDDHDHRRDRDEYDD